MNRILVPTDFSTCATNAAHFALDMWKGHGVQLTFHHVFHIRAGNPFQSLDMILELEKSHAQQAKAKLLAYVDAVKQHHDPASLASLQIDTLATMGFAIEEITRIGEEHKYDLITMGMKGADDLASKLLGSNTSFIIENAEVPVLSVPNGVKYNGLKKILHIVGPDKSNLHKLAPLFVIAEAYGAEVLMVLVAKATQVVQHDDRLRDAEAYHKKNHPNLQISAESFVTDNLIQGLNQLIADQRPDLLSLSMANRSMFQKIFHPGLLQDTRFDGSVPLLTMPEYD